MLCITAALVYPTQDLVYPTQDIEVYLQRRACRTSLPDLAQAA